MNLAEKSKPEQPNSDHPIDPPVSTGDAGIASAHTATLVPDSDVESRKRTNEAKTAFLASLNSVGNSLDSGLQTRAADIASNSTQLGKQQAELERSTAALAKETQRYQKLADDARMKLKEVGDVQNFAEVIERELLVLEETLRIVEAEKGEEDKDGSGEGSNGKRWWF